MYYLGLPLAQKVNEGDEFILSKHFFFFFFGLFSRNWKCNGLAHV